MAQARSAAIYARISSDDGTALGVARQLQDCQRLARDLGWRVGEEYVDNDVSAFSKKPRPAYERMMADIADRRRDAVLVYHPDRLHRRPAELEAFVDTLVAADVRLARSVSGGLDVTSSEGLLMLRMVGAIAAHESETKSRRLRRKHEELAERGRPNGGSRRPFGYEADRATVREDEAALIRAMVQRCLAGESVRSITAWLDATGVPTVSGATWTPSTVKGILSSARNAGLREHLGQIAGTATWPPIISQGDHRRVRAALAARATSGRRAPQRYLLSGLLRCGRCGQRLFSRPRGETRRYVCRSGPGHSGCGRLTVVADPLERLIADAVIVRLDTPELVDALSGRTAVDVHTAETAERLSEDKTQLDELAAAYADKLITLREWMTARKPIEARIEGHEHRLARATRADALTGLAGHGDALRGQWAELNLDRQAAIVGSVLDYATILPGTRGARGLDIDRVVPTWRQL